MCCTGKARASGRAKVSGAAGHLAEQWYPIGLANIRLTVFGQLCSIAVTRLMVHRHNDSAKEIHRLISMILRFQVMFYFKDQNLRMEFLKLESCEGVLHALYLPQGGVGGFIIPNPSH